MIKSKTLGQQRRKARVRAKVFGTSERPRLTVSVSNRRVRAQVVDDTKGVTLAASDSRQADRSVSLSEQAKWVGTDIAQKATKKSVKKVVLDRNSHLYHGRVKALAEQARATGLEF